MSWWEVHDYDDDDDLFDRVAQHFPYNLIDEDDEGINLQLWIFL